MILHKLTAAIRYMPQAADAVFHAGLSFVPFRFAG